MEGIIKEIIDRFSKLEFRDPTKPETKVKENLFDKYGFTNIVNGHCIVCNYPAKEGEYCLQCEYTKFLKDNKIIGLT